MDCSHGAWHILASMNKVIHFGASGHAGKMIAAELKAQGYSLTVVVRNRQKAAELSHITSDHIVADITNPEALKNICKGFDIVVSSLGKAVSLNDKSKPSFRDIDFVANRNILQDALQNGVKKFMYLSVFHADKYSDLEYFKTHYDLENELRRSGIDFSIIRPPALFSSFIDLMEMAKKGRLITMGKGDKRTNPIYEGDLARICVESIRQTNAIIEAGGPQVLTRKEINEIIQQHTAPGKKLRSVPIGLIKGMLPLIKIFDRNTYDKFSFFLAVMQDDTIAPTLGTMELSEYVQKKNREQ